MAVEDELVGGVRRQVIVNGETRETPAATVAELVVELGLEEARVATARNGAFVAARDRPGTALCSGDRIEIVSARQGG